MTKQEVYRQMELKKKTRVMNHLRLIKIHGQARGLNLKEWKSVEISVKGSGTKGKGHANNRLWDHNNLPPVQIKYDW
jgi:hypothetical protein